MSPRTHIELVKSRGWLLLLLLTMSMGRMSAAVVDDAVARAVASDFMQSQIGKPLLSDGGNLQLVYTEPSIALPGAADYYVFNGVDGFLIVAGDDRSDVVLGYGEGALDLNNLPCGMQWLLDEYRTRMEWLHTHPEVDIKKSEASSSSVVEPLLTCHWGQQEPFRDQCPTIDGKHCKTGCVATAMAQVMYYWKFPPVAPELDGYRTSTEKIEVAALPSVPLAWDDMLDRYSSGTYSESQGAAVATLMRYCGQSCKTDYGIASSSAWIVDQLAGMKKFGYDPNASLVDRLDYNEEEWRSMMLEDLYDGYPIICSGSGPAGSHNFVVDGYDGSKFHINWGWYGSSDGYFALDGFLDYNNSRQMLHRLCPDESRFGYNFMKDGVYYKKIGEDSVMVVRKNNSGNAYSGSVFIPDTVFFCGTPYLVTQLEDNLFMGCTGLTSVSIPNTIKTLCPSFFKNCRGLSSVRLSNNLKSIGSEAFAGCISLANISIPDSVTYIGESAFMGCWSLTSVSIPNTIKTLNLSLFENCKSLTSVMLPNELNRIGNQVFMNCISLANISIPDSVTYIGESVFMGCSGLTSVSIPNTIKTLSPRLFENCTGLTSVRLPNELSRIGSSAFRGCTNLQSISIPASVKQIDGQFTFNGCQNLSTVEIENLASWCSIEFEITGSYQFSYSNPLIYASHLYIGGEEVTELVIPSSVSRIGKSAFCHLPSLSRVVIPATIASIGDKAFARCGSIDRLDLPDLESWMAIDFQGSESTPMPHASKIYFDGIEMSHELEFPDGITRIPANAFRNCNIITSVSFPSSIVKIGADAFAGCNSLEKVVIQDLAAWCRIDFENNGSNPMRNAGSTVYTDGHPVTQLELPEGITSISDFAFIGAPFEKVTFPSTLVSIGANAFIYASIKQVVFPNSLVSIGKSAFSYVPLVNVEFPPNLTTIGEGAFTGCGLVELTLPEGLVGLGKAAFSFCQKLEKVHIGAGLEAIPESAFAYCIRLSEVYLPPTVKKIRRAAFTDCTSLTTMPMADSLEVIGDAAFIRTGISYLKTGNTLTTIGDLAFEACDNLTEVVLDNQVTSLGRDAFSYDFSLQTLVVGDGVHVIPNSLCSDCSYLKSVTLGQKVDTVEQGAFEGCSLISTITCKAKVPPIMSVSSSWLPPAYFHSSVFNNATLYVPRRSLDAYRSAPIWKNFQNIVGVDMVIIPGDVNDDEEVNVADVNATIDTILSGGYQEDMDLNSDGEVNVADVNALINLILQ